MASSRTLSAFIAAALLPLGAVAMEPRQQGSGDIPYVSGGVGDTQQQALREVAPQYSLGLTFANQDGAYLADVEVDIKDRAGREVLSTVTDGPMLLVDLPSGSYQVEASFQGRQKQQRVTVDEDRHRQVVMHW